MNFSDKFKERYWWTLLIMLTGLCIWRFYVGRFLSFDIYLFIIWFIIVLFPIISEISIFGLNVKKDIESAKNELKSYIAQIYNSNQVIINNIIPSPASEREYQTQKVEEETEEIKQEDSKERQPHDFVISESTEAHKKDESHRRVQERLTEALKIESLASDFLRNKYGIEYKSQIKFEDSITKEKFIVDGVIYKDGQIIKVVEIKYIRVASLHNRFYYIAQAFIQRLTKIGLRTPVMFVIVSDNISVGTAEKINNGIQRLNSRRKSNPESPPVSLLLLRFSESGLQIF